jgi:hypothetical protein
MGDASRRRGTIAGRGSRGRREQIGRAVLTVGRQCSRGRLGEGGVRWRGRCSHRRSYSSAPAPCSRVLVPSWFTSSFLRRGAASSPSPSLPAQAKVMKRRKPQTGWWLGVRDPPAWRPFEARPQAARGGLPPVPLAVRRARQVAPVSAAHSRLGCARCGGNRVIAYPAVESGPQRARTGP